MTTACLPGLALGFLATVGPDITFTSGGRRLLKSLSMFASVCEPLPRVAKTPAPLRYSEFLSQLVIVGAQLSCSRTQTPRPGCS